ncbi:MAG: glycerol-3-phosphate 1-O-acyltransferase PlsY [candidate division Zixibacteria bacterium]|nr:glycerol-3-phosphate 1-O-acyltransferase PlsY [candidate division Zixibacteria bacterium]
MLELIGAIIVSYLVGGIPTSIIAGRLLKGIDIREHGSGNAGATNVYRVLGPVPGIVVILIDAGKGVLSVLLFAQFVPPDIINDAAGIQIICGFTAILGHSFPVWAGFRGGKGIGTGAGVLFSIIPLISAIAVSIFIIAVALTKYISLGSMLATISVSLMLLIEKYFLGKDTSPILLYVCIVLTIFVLFSHKANIKRILNGTENRFGKSVKI